MDSGSDADAVEDLLVAVCPVVVGIEVDPTVEPRRTCGGCNGDGHRGVLARGQRSEVCTVLVIALREVVAGSLDIELAIRFAIDKSAQTDAVVVEKVPATICLLYTSPSPRDKRQSRMPSSA